MFRHRRQLIQCGLNRPTRDRLSNAKSLRYPLWRDFGKMGNSWWLVEMQPAAANGRDQAALFRPQIFGKYPVARGPSGCHIGGRTNYFSSGANFDSIKIDLIAYKRMPGACL